MSIAFRTFVARGGLETKAAELEEKLMRGGTRKLRTRFSKARRSLVPGAGRSGGHVFGLQGRLKRAESYLGRRAKRMGPSAGALRRRQKLRDRINRNAQRSADDVTAKIRAMRGRSAA